MADPDVLAENLRRLRLAKKLSQGELASRAGLSRVGYRNIETGAAVPKADTLARLGAALEVGLDDLVRPVDATLASGNPASGAGWSTAARSRIELVIGQGPGPPCISQR